MRSPFKTAARQAPRFHWVSRDWKVLFLRLNLTNMFETPWRKPLTTSYFLSHGLGSFRNRKIILQKKLLSTSSAHFKKQRVTFCLFDVDYSRTFKNSRWAVELCMAQYLKCSLSLSHFPLRSDVFKSQCKFMEFFLCANQLSLPWASHGSFQYTSEPWLLYSTFSALQLTKNTASSAPVFKNKRKAIYFISYAKSRCLLRGKLIFVWRYNL